MNFSKNVLDVFLRLAIGKIKFGKIIISSGLLKRHFIIAAIARTKLNLSLCGIYTANFTEDIHTFFR